MPKTNVISVNKYRTHHCGELRKKNVGQKVRLSGWVHTRRDHGGLIFIDLRDKWGITQLTFDPAKHKDVWQAAEKLRSDFVIHVEGTVVDRPKEMINKNIDTGEIEVEVTKAEVLGPSKTLPFEIGEDEKVNEELRLKYRFIDLRNKRLQNIIKIRDEFITHVRAYMHRNGFTEVQTPILANSSPEGARDFLVPSRLHPGKFYALPQAPQQFKQLLMVGGLDRYFQIAPCFRDEDPRADRHSGAFYQIDLEMSFVEQEDVFALVEPLMVELTQTFTDKKITESPFPRIPWRQAMETYGTDKPDLRYTLHITNVTDVVKDTPFEVFSRALKSRGVVHALHVEGGAAFSRKDLDEINEIAKSLGADGIVYMLVRESVTSPALKHLGKEVVSNIVRKVGAAKGDALLLAAGQWEDVCKVLGAVRSHCADRLGLKDRTKAAWCWVVDFPMFEYKKDEGKIDFSHNPFSMPQGGLEALQEKDPTTILAYQYDLALNGYEISSGAIRNHRPDIMYKAFEIAGYTKGEVDTKFGGMIRAFEYGAPPHGGFAPGIDRLMMVLLDLQNIRDIYAFPLDGNARDVMMGAPSEVSDKQLKDLHIKIDLND